VTHKQVSGTSGTGRRTLRQSEGVDTSGIGLNEGDLVRKSTLVVAAVAAGATLALGVGAAAQATIGHSSKKSAVKAASTTPKTSPWAKSGHKYGKDGHRGFAGPLAGLVTNKTITRAQADAVWAAVRAAHDAQRVADQKAVLADLVTKGTLTQAQADAIAAAKGRDAIEALITKGTITKAEADAVRTAFEAAEQAKRTAALTPVLADLVSKGTLTQAKADAIAGATGRDAIEALITKGTITQADLKAVFTALEASEKVARTAELKTTLDALVAKGTINQTQADAIAAAFAAAPAMGGRGGHGGPGMGGPGMGRPDMGGPGTGGPGRGDRDHGGMGGPGMGTPPMGNFAPPTSGSTGSGAPAV
jgi:ribosomal protein L19E